MLTDLDATDWRLLGALQNNAALTNAELADAVGISASQVSRRRARLETDGIITGYQARLSAPLLGLGVTVFIHLALARHSPENARRLLELVQRTPEILEAHALTGPSDYLLKVVVGSLKDLAALINDVLLPHESVDRVRSEIVLETLKDASPLPLPGRPPTLRAS
jgi:DNA-binding Lrp family transcriptional regulator